MFLLTSRPFDRLERIFLLLELYHAMQQVQHTHSNLYMMSRLAKVSVIL